MATQPEEQVSTNAVAQLAFQIINYAANPSGTQNVIYITTDASYNKIDLQIMLNTGSVTLTPAAEILDPSSLPPSGGGTLLYLDLTNLALGSTLFSKLQFTADNWQFKLFPDDNLVGMTPTQNVLLSAGTSGGIAIHIAQMEIDKPLANQTAQLYMNYYNVTGITGQYSGFPVAVQNRPDVKSHNLTDAITASLSSNIIINSYDPPRTVDNSFQLVFNAASGTPPQVPAGPDTLFTVTFVYGQPGDTFGYGALTDVTDALNINCTKGDNADEWIITFDKTAQSPFWTLKPPDGAPLVGAGVESTVSFNFDTIQTPYQPGPTAMLIAYKGIPSYQDGAYTLILNKVPHVIIDCLKVTPDPAYFQNVQGQEQASVVVQWATRYDTSRQLTQNFQTTHIQQNQTQLPVTLTTDPTSFTLTAYGQGGTANVDIMNVNAIVLPVINSFAGAPTEIFAGEDTQGVTLSWAVDTPGQVKIYSSIDPIHSQTSSAQNNLTETVTEPQMFTLKPTTQENPMTLTRNLVISAFNLSPQNYTLSGGAMSGAAASPSAPFAAFTNPSGNQVVIVDTVQYSSMTTVGVGASPAAIIFSQDGSLMVTANTGDNTVSVVQVSIENGTPSFSSAANVNVGGTPQSLFITPDNSHIYVSVDPGGGKAGQLVVLKSSENGYTLDTRVAVGIAPRGLAVLPSGAQIFVANSADNTISIIGVQGETFTPAPNPIPGVTGTPTGLAITPNGSLLLATCASSNSVVVINTAYPLTASRQTLSVGKQPTQIAVTPTGAYAFVTNQGDGTLSLINCSGTTSQSSVLKQGISVGTTPIGVTVSPDGLVVLVANSTGLSVVTLQIYSAAQMVSNVVDQPTDVVASPDGSAALVWHNAMLTIQGPVQPTGGAWYSISSGTLTPVLTGVPVVQCVFHPDPKAHQAFAVANNGPVLYTLDTSNPQGSPAQQVITGAFVTIAVAISGDGQHLFVVSVNQSLQYTLFVLGLEKGVWTQKQSIQLYKGKTPGQVLMQATPDASTLLIIDGVNNVFKALTWNGSQYQVANTSIQITNPIALTILPDGSKAYVVGRSTPSAITVITIATLQAETLSLIENYVNIQGLVAAPDGRRLYGTDLSAGAMRIFDPASLRILQTLPLSSNNQPAQGAAGVTIAPDASCIFAVSTVSGMMSFFQQVPMN